MPSNATEATRWTMLPLLADKSSGKSQQQQEQSENKLGNGPVVQAVPGLVVGQYGSERDAESLGELARCDRRPRAHVRGGRARWLGRGDDLCARGDLGAAYLDR